MPGRATWGVQASVLLAAKQEESKRVLYSLHEVMVKIEGGHIFTHSSDKRAWSFLLGAVQGARDTDMDTTMSLRSQSVH